MTMTTVNFDFTNMSVNELAEALKTLEGRDAYYVHLLETSPTHQRERDIMNKKRELSQNPPFYSMELSGLALVTDPCYSRDTWCAGSVAVKPGKWFTTVKYSDEGSWGIRVAELLCWHSDSNQAAAEGATDRLSFEVGVDSGQAGVFCDTLYPESPDDMGEFGERGTFYGDCCAATCDTAESFGVIQGKGVCASSGYGDGGYDAFAYFQANVAAAIRIVFISDKPTEDDMEYCEKCGSYFGYGEGCDCCESEDDE